MNLKYRDSRLCALTYWLIRTNKAKNRFKKELLLQTKDYEQRFTKISTLSQNLEKASKIEFMKIHI